MHGPYNGRTLVSFLNFTPIGALHYQARRNCNLKVCSVVLRDCACWLPVHTASQSRNIYFIQRLSSTNRNLGQLRPLEEDIIGTLSRVANTHIYTFTSLHINLLKPSGHVMHQHFNIQQLYVLPTLYLCVLYLSEKKQ